MVVFVVDLQQVAGILKLKNINILLEQTLSPDGGGFVAMLAQLPNLEELPVRESDIPYSRNRNSGLINATVIAKSCPKIRVI